jgi:AcrR family transcriptional regulator
MVRSAASSRISRSLRAGRRERELALRRDDVVAAASRVFSEKGFFGAQMNEIAARAEVSLASVYQLFASKDELFEEVTATAAEAVEAAIRARVEATSGAAEKLLAVSDALFACFAQNRDIMRIYTRATHGMPWRARGELGERTHEIFERFSAWVVDLARRASRAGALGGLDPETFASSLIGAALTNATRAVESDDAAALARMAPRVRALFANALGGGAR